MNDLTYNLLEEFILDLTLCNPKPQFLRVKNYTFIEIFNDYKNTLDKDELINFYESYKPKLPRKTKKYIKKVIYG